FIPFYPSSRTFGASVGAGERFSVAGSSRAAPASIPSSRDPIADDLAAATESRDQPAKIPARVQNPISSTDDSEDAQLAPAFGEKAYVAAVSIGSPLHTMTIDISESMDGAIMQLESLCAIPSLRDSLAKLSQLCRHLKEIEIDVDCQDDLGSDDLVEAIPELERIAVFRWNLTSRDVSRTASAIAMLAGRWKPESTLGKARDWISSDAYKWSQKIWEEVFVKIDELRGVPDT
ncbi:hypothetical protein FRC00_003193, partial [Tulasnella sp. 408]